MRFIPIKPRKSNIYKYSKSLTITELEILLFGQIIPIYIK